MGNLDQIVAEIKGLIGHIKAAKSECRNGFAMAALMECEKHLHESIYSFEASVYATEEYGPIIQALRAKREKKLFQLIR